MGRLITFSCQGKGASCKLKIFGTSEIEENDRNNEGVIREVTGMPVPKLTSMFEGPRSSTPVFFDNRVLLVGGMTSDFQPKNDVFCYDFSVEKSYPETPMISAKSIPIVIISSGKVYAFNQVLRGGNGRGSGGGIPCEVMIDNRWFEIKLPQTFPKHRNLRKPSLSSSIAYEIDAYAACCYTDSVYISIKNVCSYRVCYDTDSAESIWTISPHQLRFSKEAKSLGLTDRYVGFSRNPQKTHLICIYRLVPNTDDGHVFSFDEIMVFSMSSIPDRPFLNLYPNKIMLQPLSYDTFCVISSQLACDPNPVELQLIIVETFKLSTDKNDYISTSTRKRTRALTRAVLKAESSDDVIKCLGYTCFTDVPFPDNWVFLL